MRLICQKIKNCQYHSFFIFPLHEVNIWFLEQPINGSSEPTIGKTLLKERGLFVTETWYWICIGALVGFSLLFNALFILALTYMKGKSIYLMIQLHAILKGSMISVAILTLLPNINFSSW